MDYAPPDFVIDESNSLQCFDLAFHPHANVFGVGMIDGSIRLFDFSREEVTLRLHLQAHESGCRALSFDVSDDTLLATGSSDKYLRVFSIAGGGDDISCVYGKEHEDGINALASVGSHLVACGDESGGAYVWDIRSSSKYPVAKNRSLHSEYISDIHLDVLSGLVFLVGGDGCMSVLEPRMSFTPVGMSETMDVELTSVTTFTRGTKRYACIACQTGEIHSFVWGEWGWYSDRVVGDWEGNSVDAMLNLSGADGSGHGPILLGTEDGLLRSMVPFGGSEIIGEHQSSRDGMDSESFPIERIRAWPGQEPGAVVATLSHEPLVRFWDLRHMIGTYDPNADERFDDDGDDDDVRKMGRKGKEEMDDDDEEEEEEDDDDDDREEEAHRSRKLHPKGAGTFFSDL